MPCIYNVAIYSDSTLTAVIPSSLNQRLIQPGHLVTMKKLVLNYIGIGIGIAGWVIVGIIVVLRIALAAAFGA